METTKRLSNTYTLEEFISLGRSTVTFSYSNLLFYEKIAEGLLSSYNAINDYIDDIKENAKIVSFTDAQRIKYQYKPKLLCYDIYGSQELYFLILLINGYPDYKQFNPTKIKMPTKQQMEYIVSTIHNAEKQYLANNLTRIKNKEI